MKKVKILLSTAAVVVAVGASLASNTARKILVFTLAVPKNTVQCEEIGKCTIVSPEQLCRIQVGTNTYISYASITTSGGSKTCATVAQGAFVPGEF